jgi:hypothetical protein
LGGAGAPGLIVISYNPVSFVGSAYGVASATGAGAALAASTGSAAGLAGVSGVGVQGVQAVASAAGAASVSASPSLVLTRGYIFI